MFGEPVCVACLIFVASAYGAAPSYSTDISAFAKRARVRCRQQKHGTCTSAHLSNVLPTAGVRAMHFVEIERNEYITKHTG